MGSDRGQASVEYVAVLALLACAFAALLAAGLPTGEAVPQALARAILPGAGRGASSSRVAAAPLESLPDRLSLIEKLMDAELDHFLRYRASPGRDEGFDYSTDECSAPIIGSRGRSFDFTEACLRHDFGYRNYGPLGILDERRLEVDQRFLEDMRAHCAGRPPEEMVACFTWAGDFYRAVRAFGWMPAARYR